MPSPFCHRLEATRLELFLRTDTLRYPFKSKQENQGTTGKKEKKKKKSPRKKENEIKKKNGNALSQVRQRKMEKKESKKERKE